MIAMGTLAVALVNVCLSLQTFPLSYAMFLLTTSFFHLSHLVPFSVTGEIEQALCLLFYIFHANHLTTAPHKLWNK